jgi:negative regulator of flagellin synthesis FlgM
MTDPISYQGRPVQVDSTRSALVKTDRRAAQSQSSKTADAAVSSAAPDRVDLSQVATANAQSEMPFDTAKVDRIRQAIQQGQYAVDPKRIAENFMAIERMLKD